MNIKNNEFIGICGQTGCGKSTLVKLLLRFYPYQEGTIKIFGKDLRSISRENLSNLIGYVGQKPFIKTGTIKENIIYGNENFSFSDIQMAAQMANIHKEIIKMPLGYETFIGEGGNKLSGGQKQRLALARLFLNKPTVIILDEATSALDNIMEKNIQIQIEQYFRNKIIIAIAHRLTTLRNADRILVMNHGTIIEEGKYFELLEFDSYFSKLVKAAKKKDHYISVPAYSN